MRDMLFGTSTGNTWDGREVTYQYYITIDDLFLGDAMICESYGIAVTNKVDNRRCEVRNITLSAVQIEEMIQLIIDHTVCPKTLKDVILNLI